MKVTLADFTGKGSPNEKWRAAELMMWTKATRVKMGPDGLDEIASWTEEKKMEELAYMANTIPSSWEFCNYVFFVEGVTRSLTHQFVRTRTMSFAQQSMQIMDMSGFDYHVGPSIASSQEREKKYRAAIKVANDTYHELVQDGTVVADARDLLPHGIFTNIVAQANLRSLCDFLATRASSRNLGEITIMTAAMKSAVLAVHPWASLFLDRTADRAAADLDALLKFAVADDQLRAAALKLVDQLRARS